MSKDKEEKEKKLAKLICGIVTRFEKNKSKTLKKLAKKCNKIEELDIDPAFVELLPKISEWKKICQKINDVAHFIGAELQDRRYPCSVSVSPMFHQDTRQTYSSEVKFQVALVQIDELAKLMRKKHSKLFGMKPCRDEVCARALEVASCLSFVEDLSNRQVIIKDKIFNKSEVTSTIDFDEISKKKVKAIMEAFLLKAFELA